jgi:hypothetical protein
MRYNLKLFLKLPLECEVSNESLEREALPDLALSSETIEFLSRILLGGGASEPAFTNGKSLKISEMLASGVGGFFDRTKYPETLDPAA